MSIGILSELSYRSLTVDGFVAFLWSQNVPYHDESETIEELVVGQLVS